MPEPNQERNAPGTERPGVTAPAAAPLRESEERFRSAFENAAIGKAIATPDLRFLQVNRAYCEMLGYAQEELLRMSPDDLTHPQDSGENDAMLRRLLAGEISSSRALKRYRHKDGRSVWGDLTLTLMRDEQGAPSHFLAEVMDVTGHRAAMELLRDREAKLAEAQRIAHLGHWEYDIATDRSTWSEEFYRIGGMPRAVGAPSREEFFRRLHPEDQPRVLPLVARAIEQGVPFEYEARFVRDDGSVFWLHSVAHVDRDASGKPTRIYGVAQDVTARKRAEEALRTSEQRFHGLYTQAPVLMTVVGPDARIREVSNYWLERMGYAREDVIGHDGHEFMTPASRERLKAAIEQAVLAGRSVLRSTPLEGLRKDGSRVDALVTILLDLGAQGELLGAMTVGMDVTELRRAEEAVRESEARYRALVEHAPEAIVVLDVESGKFIDLNASAEGTFGYTREQILGMGPLDFCPAVQPDGTPSTEVVRRQIERVRAGETPIFEFVCTHASGRDFPCQIRLSHLPAKGRELIRSSVADISELKELEERVRHADKMAAIGVLAAGVAHEIGNPLLALSMAVQSLERKLEHEYAQRKLGLVREHIERISRIVRQMGDLARTPAVRRSPCDLNHVVARSLEIIRYDRRAKEVEILHDICVGAPLVEAVEDQLVQVCLNLGLNALDAVAANPPDRPRKVEVRTRLVRREARSYLHVGFKDSGPGIPVPARERIFQPFFTTKEAGKGTGLGLSVSRRIVEDHRGVLAFECADGTEFYFELPVQEEP